MKSVFAINGSASENSSNRQLIDNIAGLAKKVFRLTVFNDLKSLPHFDPGLSTANTPKAVSDFRRQIDVADGLLICTPEYVFSIPSGLKNAIEWCVATTVLSGKPTGIITASANGEKGHRELQLIMNTLMAKFTPETTLLIQGPKSKINNRGTITDRKTKTDLSKLIKAFKELL